MYNGILPVYKERGMTSHDVVFKLRKIVKMKKIGHTGTLDPEVSGVLPICLGESTKVSDYIMEMGKAYEATVTIGFSTTTEDQTGDVLDVKHLDDTSLSAQVVDATIATFKGEITQIPPMYSSVKVNGRKLYEYARKNQTVERPKRQVTIYDIARTSALRFENNCCHFDIQVRCGKGTYIRTLATDIGTALGYPAHMSQLQRTESGGFNIAQSLTLEDIRMLHEQDELQSRLFPLEYGLKGIKHIVISDDTMKTRILNGQKLSKRAFEDDIKDHVVMIDAKTHRALAIYVPHPEKPFEIKPKKVFN